MKSDRIEPFLSTMSECDRAISIEAPYLRRRLNTEILSRHNRGIDPANAPWGPGLNEVLALERLATQYLARWGISSVNAQIALAVDRGFYFSEVFGEGVPECKEYLVAAGGPERLASPSRRLLGENAEYDEFGELARLNAEDV